jgi:hypothetical protein
MCIGDPGHETDPARVLADAIKRDLDITVHPDALRVFIKCRWDTISIAAHKIHGSLPPRQTGKET